MRSLDVPQANDLNTVRAVLQALQSGCVLEVEVRAHTDFSARHTNYRLHAARVLGLLRFEEDHLALTTLGERLLETPPRSQREREVLFEAVQGSPVLQILAPDLLSRDPPRLEALADRLFEEGRVGRATAERRARGLLTWRRRILGPDPAPTPAEAAVDVEAEPEPAQPTVQLDLFG